MWSVYQKPLVIDFWIEYCSFTQRIYQKVYALCNNPIENRLRYFIDQQWRPLSNWPAVHK